MDGGSEGTREFHQVRAEVILRHWGEKMGGGGGGGGKEKERGGGGQEKDIVLVWG